MIKLLDKTVRIAQEDIKCYVVLVNGKLENPWNIEINKITAIADDKYAYIGYHSSENYDELKLAEDLLNTSTNDVKREIYEAVIPKGSKYYKGLKGFSFSISKEYFNIPYFCSDNIKLIKKC